MYIKVINKKYIASCERRGKKMMGGYESMKEE
jgi:hypothetical protein